MLIARVIGNVWATRKHESLKGRRLLLVRPIDPKTREGLGDPVMAVDAGVDAGPGNIVLIMDEGGSARQILKDSKAPVRTIVCGVVDEITVHNQTFKT